MGSSSKSSILEYARFYGIASDFTAIDPHTYIDDTCKIPTPEPQPSPVIEQLQNAQQAITQALLKEKLDIKKEGARLLSTVIRDASVRTEDINWTDVLPAFDRIERLQVETPIFPAEHDTNTMLSQRSSRYDGDIQLEPLEEPLSAAILPSHFSDLIDDAMDHIKTEKLSCSKDAFKLIQHAKICTDPSKKAVEGLLMDELTPCQNGLVFSRPSPLILSDADDAYHRSPSPVAELQMLPSLTSPHCLPDHSTQRGQSGTLKDRECDRSQDPRNNMLSYLSSDNDKDISGCVELEDDLNESLGCNNLRGTSSSGQTSPGFDQNLAINTQTVPDFSTHAGILVPPVNGSALDIDVRSCASFSRQSRADSSPEENVSETHIDAIISTGCTAIASATNDKSTMDGKGGSKSPEYLFPEQTGENKISPSSTGYFSCPIDEPIIVSDAVHAISPLRPSHELQEIETNADEPSLSNGEQKSASQGMSLQSKYKGFPNHASLLPLKRERSTSRESFQLKNKQISQRKKSQEEKTPGLKAHLPLSASLGSLSSFMEIRGRIKSGRPIVAISQYFPASQPIDKVGQRDSTGITDSIMVIPATFADRAPRIQRKVSQPSYLYVSTALLKTHLNIIRCIEKTQSALTIVYRDYGTTVGEFPSICNPRNIALQPDTRHTLPNEADIIVSPTTGVILTTSQAITQLYLPGHKSKNPKTTDLKWIDSPLREQIFLLARRYEYLYLFVSHGAVSRKGSQEGNIGLTWTADKRTLASFASLLAFCTSTSDCATIVPLWVPSSPEALAKWILSISDKHAVELPLVNVPTPQQTGFTPVNPKPQSQVPRAEHGSIEETNWEHFLRRAGLNPYAAQAVLSILNREERIMKAEGDGSSQKQGKFGSLSIFMAMSSERRQELFGELIGEKLISRVSLVIDKDWQCDWALNFNESAKLEIY
ncbi:uncharacterized protein LDX57_002783 [Aspergillus melleus]|uniref:uncharacterized protein n=1 Tax=Aspergillus melleus TaxID=138277 RepID=UPI001E8CFAC0|nr:uncharacterized protein LDX57_002783 [Aspergillus melleus]KAH8425034.1 hypothetical protein LDX57_002783 [Aspergillus melleus]